MACDAAATTSTPTRRSVAAARYLATILAIALTALPSSALAGAWTLEAGHSFVIAGGLATLSDKAFNGRGDLRSIPRYGKEEAQTLFEYGLRDGVTVMLGPSLQHVELRGAIDAERTGAGYTDIGARARIGSGEGWIASMQATFRIPGTGDRNNIAAIGYTDPEIDIRALFGHSFTIWRRTAFINLEAAQRFRLGGAPDEFRADLTLGVSPYERWLVLLQSFNVVSEGAGTWGYPSYNYHKAQISLVYALTPALSLQFGGFTTVYGRNALQENALVLAAWYRF